MYADDLVLLSPSICALQRMINICEEEATNLNMCFNSKKSVIIRIGPRHKRMCNEIMVNGMKISMSSKLKYLGVAISAAFVLNCHLRKAEENISCL